jgi:hypothetical protein
MKGNEGKEVGKIPFFAGFLKFDFKGEKISCAREIQHALRRKERKGKERQNKTKQTGKTLRNFLRSLHT